MKERKVLKVRRYKAGYETREELVSGEEYGCEDFTMKTAYTPTVDYIGDPKMAYRLCKKWGIAPERASPDHNVCSIGFCEKEQKWYGWSHRAIFGFGIGSTTKKGNCGYTPSNVLELYASLSDDEKKRVINVDSDGITIKHDNVQFIPDEAPVDKGNKKSKTIEPEEEKGKWIPAEPSYYTIEVGRGDWTAETLDDAKLMAIDFARGVS